MSIETELRARMTAYADAVAPAAPAVEAARETARRRDRARTRVVAGTAVTLLAVIAGGGLALRGGAPAARIAPAATPRSSPLPGLVELDRARLPAGQVLQSATAAGGQVWAVTTDAATYVPSLLHGASGSTLTVVRSFPGADVQVVLRGGEALVVTTTGTSTAGTVQSPQLISYDAGTGALIAGEAIARTGTTTAPIDGAAIVAPATYGDPLLLALSEHDAQGRQTLTVLPLRRPQDGPVLVPPTGVTVPPYRLELDGHRPDLGRISTITRVDGEPRYAYLGDSASSVLRLDLHSGATTTVQLLAPGTDATGGLQAAARAELDGRLLYDTRAGLLVDDGHSTRPPRVATGDLTIVAGRVFEGGPTATADLERQLDQTTLQPTGQAVVNTAGGMVSTDRALFASSDDTGDLTLFGAPS